MQNIKKQTNTLYDEVMALGVTCRNNQGGDVGDGT
jgi:hypothetical protein